MTIKVLEDWCKGCEICVKKCPAQALEISDKANKKGIYPPRLKEVNQCNFCKLCELLCPDFAITVIIEDKKLDFRREKESKRRLIIGGIVNEV